MNTTRVSRNALFTLARLILSAGVTLLLYRFLLDAVGDTLLGLWTLILATTAAGAAGNLGMGGTLVKYVAAFRARGDRETVAALFHTAVLAAGSVLAVVALALGMVGPLILSLAVPDSLLPAATRLFPAAAAAFWASSVAGLYQSYFEGLQRYDVSNTLMFVGTMVNALLCVVLVPDHGLSGVAAAYVVQGVVTLGLFAACARLLPDRLPVWPRRWRSDLLRQLLPYGARLQAMSLASMVFDPVTRYLIGFFAGVAQVAYFDLASRVVSMLRQLLVGANTTLLPAIAGLHESDPGRVEGFHRRDFRLMLFAASVFLLAPGALSGSIAVAWLGTPVPEFIFALTLLSIGWFVNTVSAPSYLFFLGRGELRWPLVSHLVIALMNPIAGALLGLAAGFRGVVAGAMLALVGGSLVTAAAYEREQGRRVRALADRSTLLLLGTSAGTFLICHYAFLMGRNVLKPALLLVAGVALYGLLSLLALRLQPGRGEVKRAFGLLVEAVVFRNRTGSEVQ